MSSDASYMRYRYIRDECDLRSAKQRRCQTGCKKCDVQALDLSPGFGDLGEISRKIMDKISCTKEDKQTICAT
jgi:hypothetical protein